MGQISPDQIEGLILQTLFLGWRIEGHFLFVHQGSPRVHEPLANVTGFQENTKLPMTINRFEPCMHNGSNKQAGRRRRLDAFLVAEGERARAFDPATQSARADVSKDTAL